MADQYDLVVLGSRRRGYVAGRATQLVENSLGMLA